MSLSDVIQKLQQGEFDLPTEYAVLEPHERARVRQQYIREQKGLCCHCGEPLNKPAPLEIQDYDVDLSLFPRGFETHPIHLHHDHESGLTIGAVHWRCNAVLWQYFGE